MALAAPGQLNTGEFPSSSSVSTRSIDCFEKIKKIGQGTYGEVFMARERISGEIVALKKILIEQEKGRFPITAMREITILRKLDHENVVKMKEVVTSSASAGDGIYMVFEYMDHDLKGLVNRLGSRLTVPQIKCYMKQLLTGLHYCHLNGVLHRDIKSSNLLINNEGNLKLADFGLAKPFHGNNNGGHLTNCVVTLWYRPPELLLGATKYGPAVDMWSVGCIFAELLQGGNPILQGRNEAEQASKIFELCGSPDEKNWPGVSKLPLYNNLRPLRSIKRRVREALSRHCDDHHALDLLDHLLTLDPNQRWGAMQALDAEYFWNDPMPCDPKSLPKFESSHELQTMKHQHQKQERPQAQASASMSKHPYKPPAHHPYRRPYSPPRGPSSYPPARNERGPYQQSCGGGYATQKRPPTYAGCRDFYGGYYGYGVGLGPHRHRKYSQQTPEYGKLELSAARALLQQGCKKLY